MKFVFAAFALFFAAKAFSRAAEGDEVVLQRVFPKAEKFEVEAGIGVVLNPTFVNTQLGVATIRYHWNESWGLGVRAGVARTSDRAERACVESFYNDPDHKAAASCASDDSGAGGHLQNVNVGPAYMPIRELRGLIAVTADYTFAYGKQILLYGATNHFDLRLRLGAGVVSSLDYGERTTVKGDAARGARGDPTQAGVGINQTDGDGRLWGSVARPAPQSVYSPAAFFGVVEEYHFARRFFLAGEISGYLTTGVAGGAAAFFVAEVSVGVRL